MILSFTEYLWYRWIISAAKFLGTYTFLRGDKEHNQYKRARRI
jgi:hypothetical protein